MKQSILKLSKNERKFLIKLLNGGDETDAEIARKINISKATASRIRKKLERQRIITDYIPIVELDTVGIDVFLVFMFEWTAFDNEELTKKTFNTLEKDPHVIFLANGEGSEGLTSILFMGFKDIEQYHEYFKDFRKRYSKYIKNIKTLILPANKILKNDFTELVRYMLKKEGEE